MEIAEDDAETMGYDADPQTETNTVEAERELAGIFSVNAEMTSHTRRWELILAAVTISNRDAWIRELQNRCRRISRVNLHVITAGSINNVVQDRISGGEPPGTPERGGRSRSDEIDVEFGDDGTETEPRNSREEGADGPDPSESETEGT